MTRAKAAAAAVCLSVAVSLGLVCELPAQGRAQTVPASTRTASPAEYASRASTGGRLVEDAAQRSPSRVRDVRDSRVAMYGGYGLAASLVLLAGVIAIRGRPSLDLGLPSPPMLPGLARSALAARRGAGTAFALLAVSGVAMVYGPDRLPPLIGSHATVWIGIGAVVVHVFAAIALMLAVLAIGMLAIFGRAAAGTSAPPAPADAAPVAGPRLLFPVIALSIAAACATGGVLVAPFRFPLLGAAGVIEQLQEIRHWHVGAGLIGVVLAIVSIVSATSKIRSPLASTAPRAGRSLRRA